MKIQSNLSFRFAICALILLAGSHFEVWAELPMINLHSIDGGKILLTWRDDLTRASFNIERTAKLLTNYDLPLSLSTAAYFAGLGGGQDPFLIFQTAPDKPNGEKMYEVEFYPNSDRFHEGRPPSQVIAMNRLTPSGDNAYSLAGLETEFTLRTSSSHFVMDNHIPQMGVKPRAELSPESNSLTIELPGLPIRLQAALQGGSLERLEQILGGGSWIRFPEKWGAKNIISWVSSKETVRLMPRQRIQVFSSVYPDLNVGFEGSTDEVLAMNGGRNPLFMSLQGLVEACRKIKGSR